MSLKITITSDAQAAAKALSEFPGKLQASIAKAMNKLNEEAIGVISNNRLSGVAPKPFPPSEHKLRVGENTLRRSLNKGAPHSLTTDAQISGDTVQSTIGTNVRYAGVHEFGFSGSIFVNSHTRKKHLRKVEGKKRRKSVAETIVTGHGRNVSYPARAPIQWGLRDYQDAYGAGMSQAIVNAWEAMKPK